MARWMNRMSIRLSTIGQYKAVPLENSRGRKKGYAEKSWSWSSSRHAESGLAIFAKVTPLSFCVASENRYRLLFSSRRNDSFALRSPTRADINRELRTVLNLNIPKKYSRWKTESLRRHSKRACERFIPLPGCSRRNPSWEFLEISV
jgi:hypothetical protein